MKHQKQRKVPSNRIYIYISALEADIFLVDAGCGLTQKPHTEGLIWVSGGSKETSANPREAKRWQARKCCSDWMKTSRSPNHNLLRGERKQEDVIHRAHKENSRKKRPNNCWVLGAFEELLIMPLQTIHVGLTEAHFLHTDNANIMTSAATRRGVCRHRV